MITTYAITSALKKAAYFVKDHWRIFAVIAAFFILLGVVGGFFVFCSSNEGSGKKNNQAGNIANLESNLAVTNYQINEAEKEKENANKNTIEAETNYNKIINQSIDNQSDDYNAFLDRICNRSNNKPKPAACNDR